MAMELTNLGLIGKLLTVNTFFPHTDCINYKITQNSSQNLQSTEQHFGMRTIHGNLSMGHIIWKGWNT